jgi:signal transduction histidine kinase
MLSERPATTAVPRYAMTNVNDDILELDHEHQPWKGVVQTLYREFQRFDDERALLRAIDKAILADETPSKHLLEEVFRGAVAAISRIYQLAQPGECYVYTGNSLEALQGGDGVLPQELPVSAAVAAVVNADHRSARTPLLLEREEASDGLFDVLLRAETILLLPLRPNIDDLLGLIIFASDRPSLASELSQRAFQDSALALGHQLAIAYNHWLRTSHAALMAKLWDVFLSKQLGPTKCFAELAKMVPAFLPDFGPLALPTPPEVQLLILERSDSEEPLYLTIRATTGAESQITKIDIADSISGLLIERSASEMRAFCDDPTGPEWKDRYKNYLGGGTTDPIRTELVVRLTTPGDGDNERLVGVLNLESKELDAFNVHHQSAAMQLATQIGPMADVFEERIKHNAIMHKSVTSTTSNYLDSLAEIFQHGIKTPLLSLRADIDLLKGVSAGPLHSVVESAASSAVTTEQLELMDDALDRLLDEQDQVAVFTRAFAADISGFGDSGNYDLAALVEQTVRLAEQSHLARGTHKARIEFADSQEAPAYCSPLIKQHLFSLFTNAIYSIDEAREDDPSREGHIVVTLAEAPVPEDSKEIELNRMWLLKVRDNGVGVTPEQLQRLRGFQPKVRFRKSPGQGFGLLATQRYIRSIGGWIDLFGGSGYFEVSLTIERYNEKVHGPISTAN